jgi:(2Fe-2S) ferredoxin
LIAVFYFLPVKESKFSATEPSTTVLICQNRTCLKQGAAEVLAAFQANPVNGCTVVSTGCLGECGNGPMVQIWPGPIWYSQVQPEEVPAIVRRHLRGGQPIAAMLYPKFHY